jgi:uncharacterized membrane protein required for colicin V production
LIDLAALAVLALAAFMGWRRGTVATALALVGLLGGYFGALLLYRPLGAVLHRTWNIPPFLAAPLGGAIALFGVSLALRIVAWKVNKIIALRRLAGWHPSTPDRTGGAVLAALWALGIIVAVAWGAMTLHGFTRQGPDLSGTLTGRLTTWATRRVTFAASRRLAGDPMVASMMAALASDPARGSQALRVLATDMRVRGLVTDPATRAALAAGNAAALERTAAVRALAADTALTNAARRLGMLSDSATPATVARDLAARAAPLARSIETIRTDPEMLRLLRDPAMQRRLASGNVDALLTDSSFNRVVSRTLELLRRGAPPP